MRTIRYPSNPGSIYHMTKVLDQGIVWGTHTAQTQKDERLINRFDYDGNYGTVLNRFLVQAGIGYLLTVPHPSHGALHRARSGKSTIAR